MPQDATRTIVCLDGYTLSPGDLSWAPFEALGKLTLHDRTDDDAVPERIGQAPCALTNKTVLSRAAFEQCPDLRYVGVLATGVNVVDLDAAREHGVTVTNVPGYSTASVAQHVFALLLELAGHTAGHDRAVHDGAWAACDDFSFTVAPMAELAGRTLGIVGVGAIGRQVATIGAALGMRIAAAHQRSMASVSIPGVTIDWMPVDDLFARADAITLHCPLTDQTRELVNADRLAKMKPGAWLINTGRGPLIDEAALAAALREGAIAGAGLDVLSQEPPSPNNPLLTAPRCVITPHCAWASVEARTRLMRMAADNLKAFLAGDPVNVVT